MILALPLMLAACANRDLQPTASLRDLSELQAGQAIATSVMPGEPQSERWWEIYRDPQLDRLVDAALDKSPDIAIAMARLAQADAALDGAKASGRPQVTGSANAAGEYFPANYVYPPPYAGTVGTEGDLTASARLHLDFWGKYRSATAASSARQEAARAEVRDATLIIQTAIVDAYVRLDTAYRLRDVASSKLVYLQDVVHLMALRTKAGLATDIEASHAHEAVTNTRSEIARLDGEIAARRNQIAALLGNGAGFGDTLQRPTMSRIDDPAPASAIPSHLLGYRPDVMARRARVEAAAKEIDVSRASFYPDIDITAFAGFAALGIGNLLHADSAALGAGPALTLPIFDGGRLRSELKQRNAEFDEAVADYDATIAAALQQVADRVASVRTERQRQAQTEQALAYWAHVVDLQKLREREGLSNKIDLLSSETEFLREQAEAAQAQARVSTAQISLIRALGGVWTQRHH